MPNKQPEKKEDKLVFKTEQYMTALYCILQSMGVAIIRAGAFKDLSNCKDKILVEYNKESDAYRLTLKPVKRKRGIITPSKRIISGLSQNDPVE